MLEPVASPPRAPRPPAPGRPTPPAPSPATALLRAAVTGVVALLALVLLGPMVPAAAGAAVPAPEASGSAPSTAALAADGDGAALDVRLLDVTPEVLTTATEGVVTATGTVTNTSDDEWRDVRIYPLTSTEPLTDADEVADAAASDVDDPIGNRITAEGAFDDSITTLEPGQTRPFTIVLPRAALAVGSEPGVYWLGVHALGATDEGRSGNAEGKDRVLLPLLPAQPATPPGVQASVVVPLREAVRHAPDGSVADPERWAELLGDDGRLRHVVDAVAQPGSGPVTWLVDPAVLDVAQRLAAGNPERTLAAPAAREPGDGATTDGGAEGDSDRGGGDDAPAADDDLARDAAAWLEDVLALLRAGELLVLPYGDTDLAGAAEHRPQAYARARLLADEALERFELSGVPAVAPEGEGVSQQDLDVLEDDAVLLVGDDRLPTEDEELAVGDEPVLDLGGRTLVVTDGSAGGSDAVATDGDTGGDAGDTDDTGDAGDEGTSAAGAAETAAARTSGLAVRQRLLADAVVGALGPDAASYSPPVVVLPSAWEPGASASPTAGLDTGWLRAVPLSELAAGDLPTAEPGDVVTDAGAETLPADVFDRGQQLLVRGARLDEILPDTDAVRSQVEREAAVLLSYAHRNDVARTRETTQAAVAQIESLLGEVTVEGPPSVTLASESGRFSVRVTNGLEQPVAVELRGAEGDPVTLEDSGPVELPPGGSATVLLSATLDYIGVFDAQVRVTDAEGVPLGASTTVPLRSTAVSDVIWIVIAVAFVLLVGTSSMFVRRRRAAARRLAADETPEPAPAAEPTDERTGSTA
ncbi:DUF6049 family protein [Nocardioides sp. ChNu-99]|uniref:DUF6049 family protein n=1 Tax=Nocardioides sp. ChNu-99 TaxID=2839897 RepID=UPI002405B12F|nr:DUF6049 family protein [Nocardioides sp. ChNu-99]MDF9716680.1 hypothetical protein [Nocardioides sp. ChNu-99]